MLVIFFFRWSCQNRRDGVWFNTSIHLLNRWTFRDIRQNRNVLWLIWQKRCMFHRKITSQLYYFLSRFMCDLSRKYVLLFNDTCTRDETKALYVFDYSFTPITPYINTWSCDYVDIPNLDVCKGSSLDISRTNGHVNITWLSAKVIFRPNCIGQLYDSAGDFSLAYHWQWLLP